MLEKDLHNNSLVIKNRESIDEYHRIIYSFSFVVWIPFLFFGFIYYQNQALLNEQNFWSKLLKSISPNTGEQREYRFLAKSANILKFKKRKYIPILSHKDSEGKGGLTKEKGFDIFTNTNAFSIASSMTKKYKRKTYEKFLSIENKELEDAILVRIIEDKDIISKLDGDNAYKASLTKIPSNYNYQPNQVLRWDYSRRTFLPTKRLKNINYFLRMGSKINDKLALPGGMPQIYVDRAGRVTFQSIKPQIVNISILLDRSGRVLDVRLMNIPRQKIVGDALVKAIEGQVFGEIPVDVKGETWIIGISWLIPDLSLIRFHN
jgi:hypothetical protein